MDQRYLAGRFRRRPQARWQRASRTSIAAYERQLRQAQKAEQAAELSAALERILNLHREEFTPATAPVAPLPAPVDEAAIRKRHEREALRGVGPFQLSVRAAARRNAEAAAGHEIQDAHALAHNAHAQLQVDLDLQWQRLLANEPDVLFTTLTAAIEDNDAPAAVASVQGRETTLIVLAPGPDAIPERRPSRTEAGNLSPSARSPNRRATPYMALVCGHLPATVREALAAAPGTESVRAAVVRWSRPDSYGRENLECVLATEFTRSRLLGIQWMTAQAPEIIADAAPNTLTNHSASGELRPLDLSREPELAELIRSIDHD